MILNEKNIVMQNSNNWKYQIITYGITMNRW